MQGFRSIIAGALCLALAMPVPAQAPPSGAPASSTAPSTDTKSFPQQELDQLLAPIALYPDALLAQVLMASTYPVEIVVAERWVKANPSLKGKALEDALQNQTWDPAVKSLAVFPQVLTMMSDKLDWTQKLGDAFLAQQQDVMSTVQALRAKAKAEGALKDTEQQKVATTVENNTTIITIEPANPEVVYVPTYNPTVVYGAWPYPAYPPYYWYPPGYYAPYGGALLGFTAGIIIGGALWGNCNWGGGNVNINVNRYNNFNRTNISNGNWNHNVDHRGAVPYRDKGVQQKYGRGQAGDAASRDAFRGRADAGRDSIQRGDVSSRDMAGRDLGASNRDYGGRGSSGMSGPSAFDTRGGAQARDYGNRGASSMGSARSSGNYGGARGGGGGARRRRTWRRSAMNGATDSCVRSAMETGMTVRNRRSAGYKVAQWVLAVLVGVLAVAGARAAAPAQKSFATPDDAVNALVQAVKAHDRNAMLAVLGHAKGELSSGDVTADEATLARFVAKYDEKHAIAVDVDKATLTIGNDDFPFAFPLVKTGAQWHFDAAAGKEVLLERRIGGNELNSIKVLQAIVDAEREYASEDRNGDGVLAYAQRILSRPGKHDGLYWPAKAGAPASPLGVLVAQASGEGYKQGDKPPSPYHGYYYRMLKGQGKNATGGAFDYVVRGRGIAGFAVVAYPAKYGNSGIMSFIVNQDGKIYQADLGPETKAKADAMQRFDPGGDWSAVDAR